MIKLPKNKRKRKGHKISENLRTGNISSLFTAAYHVQSPGFKPRKREKRKQVRGRNNVNNMNFKKY